MRAYFALRSLVSYDPDQVQKLIDSQWSLDDTGPTASIFQSGGFTLAGAQSAFSVPFGGVTAASIVTIIAFQEVLVQLETTSAPLIPVRPYPALGQGVDVVSALQQFDQPGFVCWTGKVTALFLTNPSPTADALVYVALVGDAA